MKMGLTNTSGDPLLSVMAAHAGRTVETVLLECVGCGATEKHEIAHSTPDPVIMRSFPGWTARGVNGHDVTLCPRCRGGSRSEAARQARTGPYGGRTLAQLVYGNAVPDPS